MKVYLCKQCYYDYAEIWKENIMIVDDEVKALIWQEDFKPDEQNWREYEGFEVE